MMEKINKRRLKLLYKLVKTTRINRDFFRYVGNHIAKARLDRKKTLKVVHPTNVMIELGNVCNLHCSMCPREHEYGKLMDVGFMPLEKAQQIIDQIYPYLDSCGLTGLGETFLYPHLLEIVKYIKSKKRSIIITVSTNAHFHGFQEAIEPVLPYIDNIQFSVDGIGETYNSVRKGADFNVLKENMRFVLQNGKNVVCMINCVVMPENFMQMADIVSFGHEMGIRYVNFNCMSIASQPMADRKYYEFFTSRGFLKEVEEMKRKSSCYKGMEVVGPDYPSNAEFHDCSFPWEYPYITWDGYYVPCCGKPFPKLLNFGNVFSDGVMNVLNSTEAQNFRRLWQKNIPPDYCHNCQLTSN